MQNCPLGPQETYRRDTRSPLSGSLGTSLPHDVCCSSRVGPDAACLCRDTDQLKSAERYVLLQCVNLFYWFRLPVLMRYPDLAMGFDFTILAFTTVALFGRPSAKTGLWRMLFQDGLVYFLISFTMNCIPAVGSSISLP